jgi:ribonuclease R
MVCDMLVTAKGEVHAYQFYPAVMFSHARFTYTEVAAILANTRGPEASKRKERVGDLINLHDVYRALLVQRNARGAVDFETTETQIVCDDNGRIEKIIPRTRNDAHKLIEEAMLAANVCSADFIMGSKHAGLFRVHEGPTAEKKETLRMYLKTLGLSMTISADPQPGEYAAIAAATKDRPDAQQIHTMLLRSMSQAIYTPMNSGHFGLAFEAYTHFTSPIRRYPDLLVHRVIKAILGKTKYQLPILPTPGEAHEKLKKRLAARAALKVKDASQKPKKLSVELQAWEAAGLHCSANERRADEASKDVEAWLKCKYMREHLGEEYAGTVSSCTSFGLFVTLDEMYVEGLIHVTELGGEYFKFDEVRQELRGERTGLRYVIGSRVRVQVSRVDLDGRKIDFRLVREGEAVRLPSGGIVRLEAHDDSSGKPAKRRDKGGAREGTRDHARDSGRENARDSVRDTGRESGREHSWEVPQPASRKTASRSPSKATARAPASPIQALRAAVKKAAAKGKGKRRR